jgi:hypothetical protein
VRGIEEGIGHYHNSVENARRRRVEIKPDFSPSDVLKATYISYETLRFFIISVTSSEKSPCTAKEYMN